MLELSAIAWVRTPPEKRSFLPKSPEASGPILHIVDGLLLGVGQSRKHSWGRFPGNFALFVQVPHRLARLLNTSKDLGDQLGSGAAYSVIFDPLIFNIDPEPKHLGHAKSHSCVLTVNRRSLLSEISVTREWLLEEETSFSPGESTFFRIL
jgi:hypothetical protein